MRRRSAGRVDTPAVYRRDCGSLNALGFIGLLPLGPGAGGSATDELVGPSFLIAAPMIIATEWPEHRQRIEHPSL